MPISTAKASIKSELLALNATMKINEMSDNDYADAMADIIKNAIDRASGTGTATAVQPGTGTAPVSI